MTYRKLSDRAIRHAEQRLYELKQAEVEKLDKSCWIDDPTPVLSFAQFWQDILAGKIRPRKRTEGGRKASVAMLLRTTRVMEVFDVAIPGHRKRDEKKYLDEVKAHTAKWNKIFDKFYLGDAAALLKLIEDVEAGREI